MGTLIQSPLHAGSQPRMLNINEASKACGLSPSVLRIWELRYGWPNPKRKANGYRSYSPHLVEDLKRMAELVKGGTPIRQLIVDGLPRWPIEPDSPNAKPRTIDYSRSLPHPANAGDARLQKEILDAIETRRSGLLTELLQRVQWQVRPREEAVTCLAPILCGLAELEELERPFGRDRTRLQTAVLNRSRQLLRRFAKDDADVVQVLPSDGDHLASTALATLILNLRGVSARTLDPGASPDSNRVVVVGPSEDTSHPRISILEREGYVCLRQLLDGETPLDWLPA